MKKKLSLLILFLPVFLFSQEYSWTIYPAIGVDLGGAVPFPFSDIPEGSGGTPKPFPLLGLGFGYALNENWNIGIEVNYHVISFSARADVRSQPFYFNNHQDVLYFSGKTTADIELREVEFPLIAENRMGENSALILGTYYTRILEGTFLTKGSEGIISPDKSITDNEPLPGVANTEYSFDEYIDKYDYGVLLGYKYNLNHRLFLQARIHVGFKSIFEKEFNNIDYEMYHVRLSVAVTYSLITNKNE